MSSTGRLESVPCFGHFKNAYERADGGRLPMAHDETSITRDRDLLAGLIDLATKGNEHDVSDLANDFMGVW